MIRNICNWFIVAALGMTLPANAATLGFIDDFSGPGTNGWGGGVTVSNPDTGGVDGVADGFLRLSRPGPSNLGTHSGGNPNYQGDWIAAGITGVTFYLNDVGADEAFQIHLLLSDAQGGAGTTYQHDTGFDPPNDEWQQYDVDLSDPGQWTRIRGSASFESVLQDVQVLHFRHDLAPYVELPNTIAGDVGIDNISLVPEPTTLITLALGGLPMIRRRHRPRG